MMDNFMKVIPFLEAYPPGVRLFILIWVVILCGVLIFAPRDSMPKDPNKSDGSPSTVQQAASNRDTYQIRADKVIVGSTPPRPVEPPLKDKIRTVLRRINPEIIDAVDRGDKSISVMINTVNQVDLQILQREEAFTDFLAVTSTGSVIAGGSGNRIGGHINDIAEGLMNGFQLTFKTALRSQ